MVQKNTKNVRYYCLLCCAVLQCFLAIPCYAAANSSLQNQIVLFMNTIVLSATYFAKHKAQQNVLSGPESLDSLTA